jgi:hypothetical protein
VEIIVGPVTVEGGVVEATGVVVALIVEVAIGMVVVAVGVVVTVACRFKAMLDIYAATAIITMIIIMRPACDILFCFMGLFYTI